MPRALPHDHRRRRPTIINGPEPDPRDNEYGHDFTDPLGHLNALEAAWLAADSSNALCPHCSAMAVMLPMSGNGWGLDVTHEEHCPVICETDPDEL